MMSPLVFFYRSYRNYRCYRWGRETDGTEEMDITDGKVEKVGQIGYREGGITVRWCRLLVVDDVCRELPDDDTVGGVAPHVHSGLDVKGIEELF